jgi:dolichyl-diphosphooligosaccharide--protein glycosyltransferase
MLLLFFIQKIVKLQVRIYQVKKEDPLGRDLKSANAFDQGKKRKRTRPPVRRRTLA